MKMLRKRFDCERYENSQENVSGRVYFSKAASRQCTGYNILHNRFLEKFMVYQRFNKVRPSSAQPAILSKIRLTLDLTEKS